MFAAVLVIIVCLGFYAFIGMAPGELVKIMTAGVWALLAVSALIGVVSTILR